MSYLWSFCLLVVLTGSVQGSFQGEDFEQDPPKPILKFLKPPLHKKVTFEEGISLEPKPLSPLYVKKAAFLKKCQEKRNNSLSFEQILSKKINLDIKNLELEEEIKGALTISQQKDLLALRMQSLIFQQKKLETLASGEQKGPSSKEKKVPLKKKKSPKKAINTGKKTFQTDSIYARCDDESSGSSTEEMQPILEAEEVEPAISTETKTPLLKRNASFANLQEVTDSTVLNKRRRLEATEQEKCLQSTGQPLVVGKEKRNKSVEKKQNTLLSRDQKERQRFALDGDAQDDLQSSSQNSKLHRSSAFLIERPQDEKPYLMGQDYEEIRKAPSRKGSQILVKDENISQSEKKISIKRQPSVLSKKERAFPARSSSFRVTSPEGLNAFFNNTGQS